MHVLYDHVTLFGRLRGAFASSAATGRGITGGPALSLAAGACVCSGRCSCEHYTMQ
jgi:hypothetical protein